MQGLLDQLSEAKHQLQENQEYCQSLEQAVRNQRPTRDRSTGRQSENSKSGTGSDSQLKE